MNPGYKVVCVHTGELTFVDSDGEEQVLSPVPELTIGKVYTIEKVLRKEETGFSFDRLLLVEEKGQSKASYHVNRFDLFGS